MKSRRSILVSLPFIMLGCNTGADQGSEIVADSHQAVLSGDVTVDTLGFESPSYWRVTQGSVSALQVGTVRTNGDAALAVVKPSGFTSLESNALSSSSPALAGLIKTGATVAVDINLPSEQASPYWAGAVQMYVTCPSRNIYNVYMGQIELNGKRTGVYQTLRFNLPDTVIQALSGATFSDLKFGIVLNVPQNSPGTYLLDNLRLKNTVLPARPTGIDGIHKGESTTLIAWKSYDPSVSDQVANASFTQALVQVPQSLHVVKGSAGAGTTTLKLGLTGGSTVTCTFNGDSAGANYVLASCDNGVKVGDLLPADSAQLTVNAADSTQAKTKIKVQLAKNPTGDEVVQGLPPIPTWLGGTTAELVAGLNSFVTAEQQWQLTDNVLVRLPTPDWDIYETVSTNGSVPVLPPSSSDPPFSKDGRLTNTDMIDAEWHLAGSLDAPMEADGTRKTHFDAAAWSDFYVLGFKLGPVVKVSATLDTTTPPMVNNQVGPTTATGKYCYSYLGVTEDCQDQTGNVGGSVKLIDLHPSVTLFSQVWWVFHAGAKANLDITASVSGGFIPSGIGVTFTPSVGASVTVDGGLALGTFAGGGVYGNVKLLDVSIPISATVTLAANYNPRVCSLTVSESLTGAVNFAAGSGSIGYYLEGGLTCGLWAGLCWRDEESLYDWPPAVSTSYPILPATPLANQTTSLPSSMCAVTGTADGGITYPVAGQTFPQSVNTTAITDLSRTFPPEPGSIPWPEYFDCNYFTWSSSDPSDVITAEAGKTAGCGPRFAFGSVGPRTLSVYANDPALGTAAASVAINVTAAPADPPVVGFSSYTTFPENLCNAFLTGTATDPLGQPLTYSWYAEPSNANIGGSSLSTTLMPDFLGPVVRLTATAPDGRFGGYEVWVGTPACIK